MTVRIIDSNPDPSIVKHINCGGCGVRLEYVPTDVLQHIVTDYISNSDIIQYIICPNCGNEVRTAWW
jgi:hypothetical protein